MIQNHLFNVKIMTSAFLTVEIPLFLCTTFLLSIKVHFVSVQNNSRNCALVEHYSLSSMYDYEWSVGSMAIQCNSFWPILFDIPIPSVEYSDKTFHRRVV